MIAMDHEEMIKRFHADPADLPPDVRERHERSQQKWRQQMESGQWAQPKEGDNFPIGLDDNYEPFPLRDSTDDAAQGTDENSASDDA